MIDQPKGILGITKLANMNSKISSIPKIKDRENDTSKEKTEISGLEQNGKPSDALALAIGLGSDDNQNSGDNGTNNNSVKNYIDPLAIKVKQLTLNQSKLSPTSPEPYILVDATNNQTKLVNSQIQNGKLHSVSPQCLREILDVCMGSKSPGEISEPFWYKMIMEGSSNFLNILLVDMCQGSTGPHHRKLYNSITPVFPALVAKRFKKKVGLSSFSVTNFLPDQENIKIYNAWKENSKGRKVVIVYDNFMDDLENDCWSFISALGDGLSMDSSGDQSCLIAFLAGGFSQLDELPFLKASSSNSKELTEEVQFDSTEQNDLLLTPSKFANRSISVMDKTESRPNIKSRSLSIDVYATKRASPSKKLPMLKISQEEGALSPTALTSSVSPNDQAQPPEPYSRITKNIMVGSDVLPMSPDGPSLLSKLGVTHILNMAAEIPVSKLLTDSNMFAIKWIPVYDNTEVDMDQALQDAISFIASAVNSNPDAIVFVHCKAGRSRSVSAVIGYLVTNQNYTLQTAYDLVRKTRKGVSPNLGFMAALMKVEKVVHGDNSFRALVL